MGIFLRLRHWLIFLLTYGLFVVVYAVLFISDRFLSLAIDTDSWLRLVLLIQAISLVFANFWKYAIGTRLHQRQHYNSFLLLIFRWVLYFSTLFDAARFVVFPAIGYDEGSFGQPVAIISIVGSIYCAFFNARMLNSVELQRDTSFKDLLGDFLAFIFYPIGVWWIQPRVNKIFNAGGPIEVDTPLDYKLD